MTTIVLASTSSYRKALLNKLGLHFETARPDVDEARLDAETPEAMVARLAETKARAVAGAFPNALIIGSDQVAVLDHEILGKPGDHMTAVAQLLAASGNSVHFLTGLCVLNTESKTANVKVVPYSVKFRRLTKEQIENYLQIEKPYDCAGSFKSEGLGISLFEYMEGSDPNSLIGLPLIELINLLSANGYELLKNLPEASQP